MDRLQKIIAAAGIASRRKAEEMISAGKVKVKYIRKVKELDHPCVVLCNHGSFIDFIFDSNVSEICAPTGNMFDPVDGTYRFERIIDKLTGFYTTGLDNEFKKVKNRVENKAKQHIKK